MRRMLVACMAALAMLASASEGGAKAVQFTDPAGDGAEVDVTTVTVDADKATGTITLAVTVTGFDPASWDGRPRNIQVYLDTDLDRVTGSELMLMADRGPNGIVPYYGRPKPPSWPFLPLPETIGFSQSGNVLTWVFPLSELGPAQGFDFLMYTQIRDGPSSSRITDHAPDGVGRFWRYYVPTEYVPPPQPAVVVKPVFGAATATPVRPVAGKAFTFTVRVRRSDTGAPLTEGTMTCRPSVAGALVRHTDAFANGRVKLALVVPKRAKGKVLTIRVTVASEGRSATKLVAYTVR